MLRIDEIITEEKRDKIDDLQNEVFEGINGIKAVIQFLKDKKLNSYAHEMEAIFSKLSVYAANYIKVNRTIKKDILDWNEKTGNEHIKDIKHHVVGLITHVSTKLDKSILDARRPLPPVDMRYKSHQRKRPRYIRNLFLKKRQILNFYTGNAGQIMLLYQMYNILIEAKKRLTETD